LLSEVEKTCDRVAFIRDGRILQVSTLAAFDQESFAVSLRVGQPTADFLSGLARFGEGVTLERANGTIHLQLSNEALLPELSRWVIEQGQSLYELTPQRISLEERFLQVVGRELKE
jgi:ABC-2 type transport system ATP-binding protein